MFLDRLSVLIVYAVLIGLWIWLTVIGSKSSSHSDAYKRWAYRIYVLLFLESILIGYYRLQSGVWLWDTFNRNETAFQTDPDLIVAPRKNAVVTLNGVSIHHNSQGFRGPEISPKSSKIRIAAIGGSTTYGVAVNDEDTWPSALQKILGEQYEVLNFGIPGHSSAENVTLARKILPEYKPDIVLYHVGLNDLHVMHIPGVERDIANVQRPVLLEGMGLCPENYYPKFGIVWFASVLLKKLKILSPCGYETLDFSGTGFRELDPRVTEMYRHNLQELAQTAQSIGAKVVFLPQVLNQELLNDGSLRWWMPMFDQTQLVILLQELNDVTKEVAENSGADFVDEIVQREWKAGDFADDAHLNASANREFAKIVATALTQSR